ncbi:HAD-IA family hydrolase [Streptomyces sp. NBC_01280]|uniref:HAD family hydrolase n=1 Tax=unclassified Streptomyces TaxID=2593676 RepID=UPI002E30CDBC|nr:HAD-IA family hydrolase [Streptomyces sp. NBC_01280]WSE12409.1 HAD-IA family hydrolase [Streptomyces sp. NBC_01397]WSE19220.1 HAD-IA family hydrolase [Streptomyces sp. NBC_01397]
MNPVGAVVLDTDGVLLDSAVLHASAWKTAFDGCLDAWAVGGTELCPFDADREYRELVDGKPRYDGALAFLSARGIGLPPGERGNMPGCGTVWAVAARKEQIFSETLTSRAVEAFPDVRPALGELKARGVRRAAVSASRHARALLESAALVGLFDALVDGEDAARLGLAGKPDPALFLEAAGRLGALPADTAVVEDAIAGAGAGRRGGFGLVVGIDRSPDAHMADSLRSAGADLVLSDLRALPSVLRGHGP